MDNSNNQEVMDILNKIDICLMSSYKEDRQIHTRPMAVVRKKDSQEPCLYFYIKNSSQVEKEIKGKKDVYLSYMDSNSHLYVSFKGQGEIKHDENLKRELWSPKLKNWFPEGLDDPDLGLVEVQLLKAYIWDSTTGREIKFDNNTQSFSTPGQQESSTYQENRQ